MRSSSARASSFLRILISRFQTSRERNQYLDSNGGRPNNVCCHHWQARWSSLTILTFLIVAFGLSNIVRQPNSLGFQLFSHEREAKLAFFVQVSDSSVLQVPRLLSALWHRENIYAIHLDTKVKMPMQSKLKQMIHGYSDNGNVIFLDSEPISYAGITMLLNTINAMSVLLQISADWDFFINLSGSDYPLVSPLALRQLLGSSTVLGEHLNFVQNQSSDKDLEWFSDRRIGRLHVDTSLWIEHKGTGRKIGNGSLQQLNITLPVRRKQISVYKTEGWVILHRTFAEYAVYSPRSRRLLLSLATARAADELFFATLLVGSDLFCDKIVWEAFRYVDWGTPKKRLSRPAFLDQDNGSEEIWKRLAHSGALFARKFIHLESPAKSFIDKHLSGTYTFEDHMNDAVQSHIALVRKRLSSVVKRRVRSCQFP